MKWKTLFIAIALLIMATATAAQDTTGAEIPTVTGEITAEGITFPSEVTAGLLNVTFESSRDDATIAPIIARLNDGLTMDDLMGAMSEDEMAAITMLSFYGGAGVAGGESQSYTVNLPAGDYVIILSDTSAEGAPAGFGTFTATEGDMTDVALPEADVSLAMVDFAFGVPAFMPAGPQVWKLYNVGTQWHEVIIFKAPEGISTVAEARAAMEGGEEAEQAFFWAPMAPETEAWVTIDLEAGTYFVLCFLPDINGDFSPHIEHGMMQVFTVE